MSHSPKQPSAGFAEINLQPSHFVQPTPLQIWTENSFKIGDLRC